MFHLKYTHWEFENPANSEIWGEFASFKAKLDINTIFLSPCTLYIYVFIVPKSM